MPSVIEQNPFNEYTANGVTTVFPYEFQLLSAADLVVKINGAVIPPSSFTLAGVGVHAGGTVTFLAAPSSGAVVLLTREIELARDTDYQTNGDFRADVVDRDFNRLWQALQGQGAKVGGAIRLPYPEQTAELPAPAARAGTLLGFDTVTGAVTLVTAAIGSAASLAVSLASSAGSSFIGFIQAGTGAVARTMQAKARELISSADFNNTRGTDNWGYGSNAIDSMQPGGAGTGVQNIGIGTDALTECTQGFGNTAIGHRALRTLTTPAYCTAVGIRALELANRTSDVNLICTAVGAYALANNTDGQYNTAIGGYAGEHVTVGYFNTYVGQNCGNGNVVGLSNTGIGHSALRLGTGSRNVAIGDNAAELGTTANDVISIGYQANNSNQTANQSVAIGTNALVLATAGPNLAIGYLAGQSIQTGTNNVAIGPSGALTTANLGASRNVGIGRNALSSLTSNSDNTAVGDSALALSVNAGGCAFGSGALALQTNGGPHAAFGTGAGANVTTGSNTLCLGNQAGTDAVRNITTGSNEIVVGNNSHTAAYIKVAWTVTSDRRDKRDFAPIDRGLDFVLGLQPVSFKLMDRETGDATTGTRYGFGAQDILALEGDAPILVDDSDPENLKLRESMLVPILVKAIHDLQSQIDELRRR